MARSQYLSIIDEVKDGILKTESINYLAWDRDESDILDVIEVSIKTQTSAEKSKKRQLCKDKVAARLVAALLQRILERSRNRALKLATTFIDRLCRDHLDYAPRFFDDIIFLNEDPAWPATFLVVSLFGKAFAHFLRNKLYPVKLQVFAVKHLYKMGVVINDRASKLKSHIQKLERNSKRDVVQLRQVVFRFLNGEEVPPINGDVLQAYTNLWHYNDTGRHTNTNFNEKDAQAALFLLTFELNKWNFMSVVKHILFAGGAEKKSVKSEASKSFAKLILVSPSILDDPTATRVLSDCLLTADAKALASLIEVISSYVAFKPTVKWAPTYLALLEKFFQHSKLVVRKASIEGSACLLKKHVISEDDNLVYIALSMINDVESVIQTAVCGFFLNTFLHTNNYRALLAVSLKGKTAEFISQILTEMAASKKSVCFSQETVRLSQIGNDDYFAKICNAMSVELASKSLQAATVLESFAKVYPNAVKVAPVIAAFTSCTYKDAAFLRILCRLIPLIQRSIPQTDRTTIVRHVFQIIVSDTECTMAIFDVTSLYNIFLEFGFNVNKDIQSALANLKNPKKNVNTKKKSLCIVIYLWKTYYENKDARRIVEWYLRNTIYTLTVLEILSQSRQLHVPPHYDVNLNRFILDILEQAQDSNLVMASVEFIISTLIGHRAESKNLNDIKKLGNETDEAVSQLIQKATPFLLERALTAPLVVREKIAHCLHEIAGSGLMIWPNTLLHLAAMTSDSCHKIVEIATNLLKDGFKWFYVNNLFIALKYAYKLACSGDVADGSVLRGFKLVDNLPVCSCHVPFELIQDKRASLVPFVVEATIKNMANESPRLFIYITDQIVYFHYKTVGIVQGVMKKIKTYLSTANDSINVLLLTRAVEYLDLAYKDSLKIAKSSRKEDHAAIRNKLPTEYVTAEILNAVDNHDLLLSLLKADSDDNEIEAKPIQKTNQKPSKSPKSIQNRTPPSTSAIVCQPDDFSNKNAAPKSLSAQRTLPHLAPQLKGNRDIRILLRKLPDGSYTLPSEDPDKTPMPDKTYKLPSKDPVNAPMPDKLPRERTDRTPNSTNPTEKFSKMTDGETEVPRRRSMRIALNRSKLEARYPDNTSNYRTATKTPNKRSSIRQNQSRSKNMDDIPSKPKKSRFSTFSIAQQPEERPPDNMAAEDNTSNYCTATETPNKRSSIRQIQPRSINISLNNTYGEYLDDISSKAKKSRNAPVPEVAQEKAAAEKKRTCYKLSSSLPSSNDTYEFKDDELNYNLIINYISQNSKQVDRDNVEVAHSGDPKTDSIEEFQSRNAPAPEASEDNPLAAEDRTSNYRTTKTPNKRSSIRQVKSPSKNIPLDLTYGEFLHDISSKTRKSRSSTVSIAELADERLADKVAAEGNTSNNCTATETPNKRSLISQPTKNIPHDHTYGPSKPKKSSSSAVSISELANERLTGNVASRSLKNRKPVGRDDVKMSISDDPKTDTIEEFQSQNAPAPEAAEEQALAAENEVSSSLPSSDDTYEFKDDMVLDKMIFKKPLQIERKPRVQIPHHFKTENNTTSVISKICQPTQTVCLQTMYEDEMSESNFDFDEKFNKIFNDATLAMDTRIEMNNNTRPATTAEHVTIPSRLIQHEYSSEQVESSWPIPPKPEPCTSAEIKSEVLSLSSGSSAKENEVWQPYLIPKAGSEEDTRIALSQGKESPSSQTHLTPHNRSENDMSPTFDLLGLAEDKTRATTYQQLKQMVASSSNKIYEESSDIFTSTSEVNAQLRNADHTNYTSSQGLFVYQTNQTPYHMPLSILVPQLEIESDFKQERTSQDLFEMSQPHRQFKFSNDNSS